MKPLDRIPLERIHRTVTQPQLIICDDMWMLIAPDTELPIGEWVVVRKANDTRMLCQVGPYVVERIMSLQVRYVVASVIGMVGG